MLVFGMAMALLGVVLPVEAPQVVPEEGVVGLAGDRPLDGFQTPMSGGLDSNPANPAKAANPLCRKELSCGVSGGVGRWRRD